METKKTLANSQDNEVKLIISDEGCLTIEDGSIDEDSECSNGVHQEYQVNSNSLTVIFTPCIETGWIILLIVSGVVLVLVVPILLLFSPLKKHVTPYRRKKNIQGS